MNLEILDWWQKARPFFLDNAHSIVAQIDDDISRLTKVSQADASFCVCVLGQSAVGKSTLLNAIVARDETILPAGGIGPLTALATEVRYSEDPYFLVTYRDKKHLAGFRLQIESELKKRGFTLASDPAEELDTEPEVVDAIAVVDDPPAAGEASRQASPAIMELSKQLTQLITGDQFHSLPLPSLLQGFRAVLGLAADVSSFSEEHRENIRLAAAKVAVKSNSGATRYTKSDLGATFDSLLRDHVSGFLAPLVERIEVGYPASTLDRNVVLVDLPGIGVANDRYRTVTSEYIRLKASAVMLVVDRAGPTQASVDLIRDSGYWDRLLLSSADPERDPCELLIAVTKVDDVAREQYIQSKNLPKDQRPSVASLFLSLRRDVRTNIRKQAEHCFSALTDGPATDVEVLAARQSAQSTLLRSLEVFPVSATEYRTLIADDEDQRAFIKDEVSSGIPDLMEHIDKLAEHHRLRLQASTQSILERLERNLHGTLEQITSAWSSTSRAAYEAEELRIELARFLEPKRAELANRTGAFREFLETSGSTRIAELVAKAQIAAQIEVAHYLRQLRDVHWSTLRATVVRGGAYVSGRGLRVDLAADVAQRFQEPMAGIWGRTLLKNIRARTTQHGKLLERVIAEICVWADGRADTTVQREILAAQQVLMKDRVEQLSQVGSEAVDDLKDAIKRELMATIEKPIRAKCEEFKRNGDAAGPGVKNRILTLFDNLAADAVLAAAQPATTLLQNQFMGVRTEIAKALEDWGDPITQASDAIVEREEQRQLRSDAQRRKQILARVDELRANLPILSRSQPLESNI